MARRSSAVGSSSQRASRRSRCGRPNSTRCRGSSRAIRASTTTCASSRESASRSSARGGLVGRMLFHHSDVGPALISHVVARPTLFRRAPVAFQRYMTRRSLVPGASLWLRPRIGGVAFSTGRRVAQATRANAHLRLRLDDGSTREVDHLLLATGYRVDIRRYAFLAQALVSSVRTVGGSPVLGPSFESSVPGLYFLGAPAALSFGPVLRFVSGGVFATRTLARSITGHAERHPAPLAAVPAATVERRA